ncbi:hypothetical protein [Nocardioides sp. Root190]|uniref:hypothetical protein n=1 Tax=Nocardioides sp. Root190 TaxID=1736488 RepID=UPI0012F7FA3F|nr:hypothetical protein [Nocardioides sp. Root190]
MRTQEERDEQTITIATVLAIFGGIAFAVFLVAVVVNASSDLELPGAVASAFGIGTLLLATVAGMAYLVRHRSP